jgi:hypothetical protein
VPSYSQITLAQFVTQISTLMDDITAVYWTVPQIQYAVWEALRVWGALTNYWRTRGTFNLNPASSSPYYDLSVVLPALRTRTWTLNQMTQEIQYMLDEAANGISGAGMSGQVNISTILNAIQTARDQFVLDTHLPLSYHSIIASPPPANGMISFPQASVYVHRASWQDTPSGIWTNLWRTDAWAADKANYLWTEEPGAPQNYSEAENAPLMLQLIPAPSNEGLVDALTVDSLDMDLTNPATTFDVPDEWVHGIKYGALNHILSAESQIYDALRAQYAATRYSQAVEFAKDARSIIRLLSGGAPLNVDSLVAADAGNPYWRNQSGAPQVAGVLYDVLAVNPGSPDLAYGMAADVVQSAPLPQTGDYIQLGQEDLDHIVDYVMHILTFKCGGTDFKSTMASYDSFMAGVARRKAINTAKIQYMTPLFAQQQFEWAKRPDVANMAAQK